MKKLLLNLFLLFSGCLFAQVGINTTTPNAQLDIRSSNQVAPTSTDGMLIPKVDTFPASNPTVAQQGMLVYLTTNVGSNVPGFYYWNNPTLTWIPIGNNNNSGWNLTGNSGTNPATNFIGTTDNQDVVFRRNNLISGRIGTSNSAFGSNALILNSGSGNSAFGIGALQDNLTGNENTAFGNLTMQNSESGQQNTAFGSLALQLNINGGFNTAIGRSALRNSQNGYYNTAVGSYSIINNTSGQSNSGFGSSSLSNNTTGMFNTAVGRQSLIGNITGSLNSAFGNLANVTTSDLTNATAIGARSEVGASNAMVLGSINGINGATSSVNVGIGTTTPLDRLHIVGNFRMVDGNQAIGRVLTSDVNGRASWQNASNNAWGLIGNTGTNAATNFIGTTDDIDLVFKRFNVLSGRISDSNTFFGRLSGSVSTATDNTYIGTEAGRDNITGQQNVFIGRRAGTFGASGSNNIFIGNGAGIFNEANQNTFVGSFSGNGNSTSANNSFFGYFSGASTSTGGLNTFIGAFAGNANTIGTQNTLVGNNSNVFTNSLTNATAIGSNSMVSTSNSLVLGSVSGVNSATSTVNVGIGTTSPLDRLHVEGNIRMVDGNQAAGRVLTSDNNGTATWQNASANAWGLNGNTGTNPLTNFIGTTDNQDLVFRRNNSVRGRIGNSNLSFGWGSNPNNTGIQNIAIGIQTLSANSFGANNSAYGPYALRSNTTGHMNSAFGFEALGSNNSGEGNTALGSFSQIGSTTGSFNTSIGYLALGGNYSGSENTAVGYLSDVSSSNLTNANAIGSRARVSASNSLVLGSISGVNGASASVNVGIGTTTPQERLHVAGRALLTNGFSSTNAALLYQNNTDYMFVGPQSGSSLNGGAMALYGSTNSSVGNAGGIDLNTNSGIVRLTSTGNLGVGTNNPLQKLHVSGPAGLTAVRIANSSGVPASSNVALDFFRAANGNTDWRIFNIGANLTIGNSGDDLATVNNLYQFQGVRFMPMTDATISLGQGLNRWNTLFASNGTINTSDEREKKNIQNLHYGLNTLMQLRPVSFEWKKDDGSGTKLGLIAQELQQVVPEVVRDWDWEEDDQGNRKKVASPILGVYYSDLIPVLIKATQEQQVVIEQQKEEINLLKQQLQEQYKSLLERLEKVENK